MRKNSKGSFANLTAGERSDGEASYARMADKAKVLPLLVGNYNYDVRTVGTLRYKTPDLPTSAFSETIKE